VPRLHVVCARGEFDPYVSWIDEAWGVVSADPECAGWVLSVHACVDSAYRFNPLDAFASIAKDLGPVLLVGQLSTSAVMLLQAKLKERVVSQWCADADDSTVVYEAMLDLILRHETGDPEISRRLAVALMLVAKLERMHYWGGDAKGYMSVQNLAKSNGLDQQYKATAIEIAEYLSSSKRAIRLLSSKLGDGNAKYACNNERRPDVYEFLRTWSFRDEQAMNWLTRDTARLSVRELDEIRATSYEGPR